MWKLNRRFLLIFGVFATFLFLLKSSFHQKDAKLSKQIPQEEKGEEVISRRAENSRLCYYDDSCAPPQILFRIQPETDSAPPFACLNDIRLFDTSKIERGLNIIALNGSTGDVFVSASFDVTTSDEKLMTWLSQLPARSIIVAASFGDVAERVSMHARKLLASFGATKIEKWRAGTAYVLIGQRGVTNAVAYEAITSFSDGNPPFEGCFDLPFGDVVHVANVSADVAKLHRADEVKLAELGAFEDDLVMKKVQLGGQWTNCGMEHECDKDAIPVYFFSGEHKDDHPKMCIGGHVVFDRDLNNAGRGLNIAMIEPKTSRVTAVAHFDTYQDESRGLEEWLDAVPNGYIVAVVSFDEASNMLSEMAKRIFYELGSSMIERLKFRASWYFIGYKGIGAYTPFEDLNLSQGNSWAKAVKTSFCLPKSLAKWNGRQAGEKSMSSMGERRNLPKRHFCAKYDRHEDFCEDSRLDEAIVPLLLSGSRDVHDAVFNLPILIVGGLSPDSLRRTLESLMQQEGINTQMVLVAYDKEYPENGELSSLFHVKSVAIANNGSYNDMVLSALSVAFSVFPEASSLSVIEEDVVLSPDWLHFLSDVLTPFLADPTIDFASTFNPNGFTTTSGRAKTVYRRKDQSPMFSYLLKKSAYRNKILGNPDCCMARFAWDIASTSLVPDLSRVRIAVDPREYTDSSIFSRPRISSEKPSALTQEFATEEAYVQFEESLIENSTTVLLLADIDCASWEKSIITKIGDLPRTSIVIKYDGKSIAKAAKCFGLQSQQTENILRFTFKKQFEVVLVPENFGN